MLTLTRLKIIDSEKLTMEYSAIEFYDILFIDSLLTKKNLFFQKHKF